MFVFGSLRLVDGDGECGCERIFGEDRERIKDKVITRFPGEFAVLQGRLFEHEAGGVAVEYDDACVAVVELEHFLVLGDDEKLSGKIAGVVPLDCFALLFLLRAPKAFDFTTNFFVDVFDAAESPAFGAEDALCERELPDFVAALGFAMVGVACFGACAFGVDLFCKGGELREVAGPFGDEVFDALVFFFFRKRCGCGFELLVENVVLELRGCCVIACDVGVARGIVGNCARGCEFVRNELCVVFGFGYGFDFACEFSDVRAVIESVGFVELHRKVAAAVVHFEDFAEDGSGVNGGELERVAENEYSRAFGNSFEEGGEHFDVDHACFVNDEDGIFGELFFAVERKAAFAFGESEQAVYGAAFEFVQFAEYAFVCTGFLFVADSSEAIDEAFAHAVGGFAAWCCKVDVPIEHFAVAFEQIPQDVKHDGCFACAGAACDDEVFGLAADDGFGLAFFDEELFAVAEWLTHARDFLRAVFDFFVGGGVAVFE